jgi:hypothetical protein
MAACSTAGANRELLRKERAMRPGGKPETRRMADVVRIVGDTAKNKRQVEIGARTRAAQWATWQVEGRPGSLTIRRATSPIAVLARSRFTSATPAMHVTVLHEAIHVAAMSRSMAT